MAGRMGNQMCRYACARMFQKKLNIKDPIVVDFSKYPVDGSSYGTNYLSKLNCADNIINGKCEFNIFQKLILKGYESYFRAKGITNNKNEIQKVQDKVVDFVSLFGLYIYRRGYHKFKIRKHNTMFLSGNFEGHKYFDDIRNELLIEFMPKSLSSDNQKIYDKIKNGNYIAVCVRKGDFTVGKNATDLDICTPRYYYDGVQYIKNKVKEPHKIIIFSADLEWVKNNINLGENVEYMGSDMTPWEQMKIMSACNHFVICNSTFFWWAQYLADKPGKIVVAPIYWSSSKKKSDLYMNSWHLINP